ncbi:MAG: aminotransferase class V-fold PLP-dependent enzyme [Candidatus Latescibacteria bacterium]|nr:aminotransferase class V-fold PLP-dependent enzyme [bacterium]MBD3423725.1 aminotransferase class V-fold PLP-dependent enzyme [Candidatus Latescibacterota bacterium]
MENKRIYLDHNATTPLHPEVKKKMADGMELFGNPSSMHTPGREARRHIEKSREAIASFIGADAGEIVFVGSGSEANNSVLSLMTCQMRKCSIPGLSKPRIITTVIEHPCILETCRCMLSSTIDTVYLEVDESGKIDMSQLEKELEEPTLLVSIMTANNEIGTLQDIKTIAGIVHSKGALFHTDAAQAVGKIPVDVNDLGIDYLTISGHKVYGPKGIGALYVRKGSPFCPLIHGGHQESGRRAGTENTLGIIGFGKAIEMRKKEMEEESERLLKLKKTLREGLEESIQDIRFIGHPTDSLPGTLNVSFAGVEGEAVMLHLDLEGIAVSTGSACSSGSLGPSHVILATGVSEEFANGSIRIGMGRETTMEEIQRTLDSFRRIIPKLRKISSRYITEGR